MRSAFFCTTPYQVLTSIVLKQQLNGSADIYIIDQFSDAEDLSRSLRAKGIFENVIFIEEYSIFNIRRRGASAAKKRLKYLDVYLRIDKIVERVCPDVSIYTDLFASCNAFVPRLFFLYAAKHKLQMQYHFYDDGIGSYYNRKIYTLSGYDYYARRLLIGKKAANIRYDIYLYQPEMFAKLLPDIKIETHKISAMDRNADQKGLIDEIYKVDRYETIRETVVFLDIVHSAVSFPMGNDAVMEEIGKLINIVGKEDFLVKPHPRDTKRWYDCGYYSDTFQPMEVLCMHQDFTDTILITFFSTAVFTPKMLYDQEPTIVLMYKAFGSTVNIELKDELCRSIASTYSDESKVIVPNTLEELNAVLNTLSNKGNAAFSKNE